MLMDLIQKSANLSIWKKFEERATSWRNRTDELHEKAIKAASGYDNFGDSGYREGFDLLMGSYDEEARFHPLGRRLAEYQVVGSLTRRLLSNKFWEENPEVLENDIKRPLVITGMVRTGSTALHYLMGTNPDTQALQYWLATHPQPRPPEREWRRRLDFYKARAELALMYGLGEGLEAIHHITPQGPEECRHLMAQDFIDESFEVGNRVPTYANWYAKGHHVGMYQRHKKLLLTIGSNEPEKRWLLKYPVHLRHIDSFLEVYPDACIIQTHRDPAQVLDSYVSLVHHFRKLQEREADLREIALEQMEVWATAVEKGLVMREKYPERFYDIHFQDFIKDPIAAVEAAYDHYDQPFSDEARKALEQWRVANPQGKWGKHSYDKGAAGLSKGEIHERFARYMEVMGIERESK
jgi:hypothetical protein